MINPAPLDDVDQIWCVNNSEFLFPNFLKCLFYILDRMVRSKNHLMLLSLNPLPDSPRSNRTLGFQRHTAQSIKELKIWKKLQLSDDILRLFYNIRNLHIWHSTAISLQSQNPCHNKSTQQEAPQRSDLACRGGGMTHRV